MYDSKPYNCICILYHALLFYFFEKEKKRQIYMSNEINKLLYNFLELYVLRVIELFFFLDQRDMNQKVVKISYIVLSTKKNCIVN